MAAAHLSQALSDGACLIGSEGFTAPSDLRSSLENRLSRYYARCGTGSVSESDSLEKIQLITATEALSVVGRIQRILGADTHNEQPVDTLDVDRQPLLIGTQDLAELRTLLSITFKWGIDPLMSRVVSAWPGKKVPDGPRIMDLTTSSEDYTLLSSMACHLLDLLFPGDPSVRIPETLITVSILNRHLMDLLRPCITLGWLPRSLASDSRPPLDAIRPRIMRLLTLLPPSQTISAIGGILSSSPTPVPHARKTCSTFLSQQLLRPQGVRGLCAAVFGEGESSTDDTPIEKLEHVVRVLTTVPSTMSTQKYFYAIIPRIMELLASEESPVHKRVASFSISLIILKILHQPFRDDQSGSELSSGSSPLYTLITLISNTDPSPTLISALLTPVMSTLYSLLHHMDKAKTSDPNLKESLRSLLVTWGKIVGTPEGIISLWTILDSDEGLWKLDSEGQIHKSEKPEKLSGLSLLTPADLRQANEGDEVNIDTNILNLYPDPMHFVRFLKEIDRPDISSDIFVKLLEAYRAHKAREEVDPTRTLLYLQIIMQMQTQMSGTKSSSSILFKPTHLLAFVKHVLEPLPTQPPEPIRSRNRDSSHIRLFPDISDDLEDEGDSDDDTPGSEVIGADDEMIETCINLLLSILEVNEDLSARTLPLLNEIFSLLEPLARDGSATVRPLAREARMVMTARLASTSTKSFVRSPEEESAEEIYQKALKLLQDPILPVRAHGLLLLRQLVSPPSSKERGQPRLENRALVPAILSIFLQSIHDDDSYVFLNAIQGLAAMVDTFGKDVLHGLLNEYTEGLEGLGSTNLTRHDVDNKIRIGEALGLVIRRCGDTLGIYVDLLVPPFFNVVRSRHLPNTLRTSSLSLLAECESINPLAMLSYVVDLAEAMIDLLQIESTPSPVPQGNPANDEAPTQEFEPTSNNSKLPPLRQAALHLLSLAFRETTKAIYDSSFGESIFSNSLMRRAKTTLSYVASTDEDVVVRVMAREAGETLDQMQQAIVGI